MHRFKASHRVEGLLYLRSCYALLLLQPTRLGFNKLFVDVAVVVVIVAVSVSQVRPQPTVQFGLDALLRSDAV